MNFKKIIASAVTAAMMISMSIPAFATVPADGYTLKSTYSEVTAGQEFEVSLTMPTNTAKISAMGAKMGYNATKFEFISVTSDFFPTVTSNDASGSINVAGTRTDEGITDGKIFNAKFKVKNGALGGAEDFKLTELLLTEGSEDETIIIDKNTTTTEIKTTVTIKAPEKLTAPDVTITDKTASWTGDANAKDYKVVLTKNGTEIYEFTTTATSYDFSGKVDTSAEYGVEVTALKNTAMYLESDKGSATATCTVEPTVTPTTKDYVTGSGDVVLTVDFKGNTLSSIDTLGENTDYTVGTNSVTIKEAALGTDTAAKTYNLKFAYNGIEVKTIPVTINVKEAANSATLVLAERTTGNYGTDDTVANDGSNDGLIVVTNPTLPVTDFIGVQFRINNIPDTNCEKVDYEIVPADGYSLLYDEETELYEINVKPVNGIAPAEKENAAGEGIVIGKLVRKGNSYGKGTITAGNIIITVEKSDNTYAKLSASSFDFKYDIEEPTETLNVNVDFRLPTVVANAADYQNMTVNLYSARLGNIELALAENDGTTAIYTSEDGKIEATLKSTENNYALAITGLPKFEAYTVSIKGDGYRDAKAQFVLNEETTVNFWNNANETERVFISKVGGEQKLSKKNFLAGDIIMNGKIDLYDLSAVSSYFGKALTKNDQDYIQYDLNRDGKVDIIDITMLLAGWAE